MSSSRVNLQNYLIPLEEINRATENFSQERCIGGGGFGAVYKGQLSERWKKHTVAIKRLGKDSHQGEHEFRNELEMISSFHHENIISFIGYCHEGGEMIIVYDYAINGSLDHHLQNRSKMGCITWIQRLMICIGAARGLNYLHSGLGEHNRVIHRDVKSSNILLDDNLVAKVCDFGLSKLGPRNQLDTQLHTRVAGTQFYLDPTYHESRILRKESDVYSFGVVLFEILSGTLVYHEISTQNDVQKFLMTWVRRYHKNEPHKLIDPQISDQIDRTSFHIFQEIAYQCISFNLSERPTMDKVIERIEEALSVQIQSVRANASPDNMGIVAGDIHNIAKIMEDNRIAIRIYTNQLTIPNSGTQEQSITAILNLLVSEENKGNIVSFGAVPGIVLVLKVGSMEARENAAATLLNLSVIDQNKEIIGAEGAIAPLLLLLSKGSQKGKKVAITALFSLCLDQGNKGRVVRAGVAPILMELLNEPEGVLMEETLSLLATLLSHPEWKLAIGKEEVVPVLVEIISSGSPKTRENAAAILVKLCSREQKYLVEAMEHGLKENLMDLLKHGTDRGKRKARKLLRQDKGPQTKTRRM
ncbi:probable receptor-like protein kinase At5g59700 [Lactuca sativa]|uniref:probable receptor-like protein kinase At5g59700 n=1 Tax=Lactuca sativa TaxID=4236 RepID=UPI000CC85430|nr:probable receptor-like protein kinase At5g59700 [Lactuca sativa]